MVFSIKHLVFFEKPLPFFTKKLYSFCNLEWSEKALNFYNRKDLLVSTASNIQIRKKVNSYDREKYKPYNDLLKKFTDKYGWIN